MLRGSAVSVVVAIFGVAGIMSAGALRSRSAKAPDQVVRFASAVPATPASDTQPPQPASAPVTQQGEVARRSASRTVVPMLPLGETSLGEGVTAFRSDTGVLVAFDSPLARTRMPEKFERFVRTTLPRIYGVIADSALAHVPLGSMARSQQELLYELPARGVRIAMRDGHTFAVYPEIRPGEDGPLVVRYRVAVVAN